MLFTSATMLNRWGSASTATGTVKNWRAKRNRASHRVYKEPAVLWALSKPRCRGPSGGRCIGRGF